MGPPGSRATVVSACIRRLRGRGYHEDTPRQRAGKVTLCYLHQACFTTRKLRTSFTPLMELASLPARERAASSPVSPLRVTTPALVSTSIFSTLRSGSLRRSVLIDAVIAASDNPLPASAAPL